MNEIAWNARCLLRAAKSATLATTSPEGQPDAALVTPAPMPDLSLVLLLSGLSAHTRHLATNPRCALLVQGEPDGPNPQTAPRLCVFGQAGPDPDPAIRARWLMRHPYASFYADLPDFRVVRVRITGAQYVGGFARAGRLSTADLLPDPAAVQAVAQAEARVIGHMNADHRAALAHIAGGAGWTMTAADVDGCDLSRGEEVRRFAWSAPVTDAAGIRAELVRMAGA